MIEIKNIKEILDSVDSSGCLMPCWLWTEPAELMRLCGFVENFVDEDTGLEWQRLTARGTAIKGEWEVVNITRGASNATGPN